jgi:hypothetical protein
MTCRHALDIIDAGPFADCSPAQFEAGRTHAADCGTCGPALATSEALTADLRGLAQPVAPAHLKTSVMARIANVDLPGYAQGASVAAGARVTPRDWSGWAPIAGLALGLVVTLPTYLATGHPVRIWNTGSLAAFSAVPQATLAMMLGLAVFVGGLILPLVGRRK